ncbi:MAG: bifunctional nuclease family protein [Candidatus Latescibacteria bacterium]|nr:bifunctional nuclease family protein [Candidatus Latescibacterota bacterium]
MIEMKVSSILFEPKDQSHLLCLVDLGQKILLPIAIGPFEARAISAKLLNERLPRPITYDLLRYILESLDAKVLRVVVNDLREGTFYAQVVLESAEGIVMEIDSRPSDAIALALRVNAPIYVEESVLEEVGMDCPPHLIDQSTLADQSKRIIEGYYQEADEDVLKEVEEDEEITSQESLQHGESDRIASLKVRLSKAIQTEEYEEAARIRDELRHLEEENK